jgi:hypothetical protein
MERDAFFGEKNSFSKRQYPIKDENLKGWGYPLKNEKPPLFKKKKPVFF